jgi:Tfp pilus assembly protein PilP
MKYITWFLISILLFQFTVSGVLAAKINQSEKPPAVTVKNPFRSLLLENKDLTSLTKSPSKPGTSRKKYSSQKKKQVLKQNVIAGVQEKPLIQKADFSLRVKELFLNLKLKDILETSEGRYALIDENKVTYFVQQGEWLGEVFVKHIDKNQVELKEIYGETTIILELKP